MPLMATLKKLIPELIKVSRPRSWPYVFAPFLIGLLASPTEQLIQWQTLFYGLYFLFPANLTIYGINDIFDYKTDKLNGQKLNYDSLAAPRNRAALWIAIAIVNAPMLVVLPWAPIYARLAMASFLFFSIFYSAPPIRAKARPFFDSAFNILFLFPGLLGFYLGGGITPSWAAVWAAALWYMALHAYRAVPDIEIDRGADLRTIATVLGKQWTLAVCLIAYLIVAYIAFLLLGFIGLLLGTLYIWLVLRSMRARTHEELLRYAEVFRWTNTATRIVLIIIFLDLRF